MSQFTYVIDEQRLSSMLRNISAPLKEDAWQKFDSYAEAHTRPVVKNRLQNIRVSVNRQVLLPVAFGMVILLFSFLLFNFISIKGPQADLAPIESAKVPHPQVSLNPLSTLPAGGDKVAETVEVKAVREPETTIVAEKPAVKTTSPAEIEAGSAVVADESLLNASASQSSPKKVQRKRSLEASFLDEIRPTMITEDMEPEIRPN